MLKYKHFEYAVKVSKVCVDLCPTSYEGWTLYAECLIELQEMQKALLVIDLIPLSEDLPYITLPEPEPTYDLQVPLTMDSTACFQHFIMPIEDVLDYSIVGSPSENISLMQMNLTRSLPEPYQDDIQAEISEKFYALVEHNMEYQSWTEHFKGIYHLLVLAEIEHGYELLMAARKATFLPPSSKEVKSQEAQNCYNLWSNPFMGQLPASYQIPGLERLKREAAIQARAERRHRR